MAQPKVDVAVLKQSGRTELEDKVPQTQVMRVWNVPEFGARDADLLDLVSRILGGSAGSRLDARLVYQDKLVDRVSASNDSSQLGGNFDVTAMVKQGVDAAKVEAIIDEELQRFIKDGPTAEELARAKTSFRAGFIRGIERIGGFGGKADALAACATYTGNPGCFRDSLKNIEAATPEQVRAAAAQWLGNPSHTFVVKPGERKPLDEDPAVTPTPFSLGKPDARYTTTTPSPVDRTQGVPKVDTFPQVTFPKLQRATLKNGSTVVLAERHEIPVVQISYEFNGGFASDKGGKLGTASFASGMLREGAGKLGAMEFKTRAEDLGAQIGAGASMDGANVYLSALKDNLDASVALYASTLRAPRFDQSEIERVRAQRLAGIRQEKVSPQAASMRVLPSLLYGSHPYGLPFTGSGTEADITAMTRDDLLDYKKQWLRPEKATVIVVGDTTLAEIVPILNKHFGDWKGEGKASAGVNLPQVQRPDKPRVYLIDQPGAIQANIYAAQLMPSSKDADATTLEMANAVLGGSFTSRVNMNLREDKHWSYGARTQLNSALGQRPFQGVAPVQIDKTAESVTELNREIADYGSGKVPATAEEVAKVVNSTLRGMPGVYETATMVMNTIGGIVRYGRPDNWVQVRSEQIAAMTPEQINAAAKAIDANTLTWVIVGDLTKTEAPVRALNIGEVTVLDADGKPVADKK
jgi:predicted Zn-dependent peptidase